MPEYNVDYYIQKFEATNDDEWGTLAFESNGKCCALGHCGWRTRPESDWSVTTEEGHELVRLFYRHGIAVASVNDCGLSEGSEVAFLQPTPRARILAALAWIKEQEAK